MRLLMLNSSIRALSNCTVSKSCARFSALACKTPFKQNGTYESYRNLYTGCRHMKEAENKPVKQDTAATNTPAEPETTNTPAEPETQSHSGGFKWENRTRFATGIMVVWLSAVAIYVFKKRSDRKDLHHSMMFNESLRNMSDEERNKIIASMKAK